MNEATEDQISKVSIPENLHPNAATFRVELQTVDHRFYFQTYSSGKVLTTKQALSLFLGLADDLSIRQKYGHVKITVVQSRAGLNALFKLPVIKEIKITINKPHADIFADDFEEQIEAPLEKAHSQRVTIAYEAQPGQSVKPTEENRTVREVELESGVVELRSCDAKGAVKSTTKEKPK